MKRREGRKLLSILLTLALVFSMIPGMSLTAYADDDISYEDRDNITTPVNFDSGEWYPVDNDDDTETLLSEECVEEGAVSSFEIDDNTTLTTEWADTTAPGTAVITGAGDSNVNKEYTDFSEAFTAWKGASPADGQDLTLKLLENVEINFPVSLDGANTLTLDLNGHGIKNKGTDAVIVVNHSNAYLNLKDSGSDVSHNYTVFEGLAYVNDSASGTGVKTFTGGYITGGSGNSDPNYGGGICIRSGHVTLSGGNIIGNEAASGGGVYVDQGHFEMTGGKICGNRATGSGGGVYVNDSGTFTMTGGTIEDNTAVGATVYTYGGNVNISGSASLNGSIQAENNGTVTITGGKFYYPYDPTQFLTSAYKAYGYNSDGSLESFDIKEGGYWIVGFKYPVYVDGTQVTNINAGDVLGDGKVSYTPAVKDDPATTDVDESAPATLSLNGYSSYGAYQKDGASGAIYAGEALTIELSGRNTIDNDLPGDDSNGIFGSKALTIKGDGELTVKGLKNGIHAVGSLTIESGTVTAIATTKGENGRGIYANNSITISGGTVTAEDSGTNGYGIISSGGPITISGGTVTASATGTGGTGIWAEESKSVHIDKNSEVTAIGNDRAINSYVLNTIAGTGWTDMAGTEGRTLISVSETGQDLSSYKKVLIQLHTHDFSYSADMDILTATCTVTGCTLSDNKVELSIIAPTLTTYGETGEGISANATLSGLDEFNDVTGRSLSANDIIYAGRNETTYAESTTAPVNAGDYKAMITLSNVKTSAGEGNSVTAGVEYSIARAAMTVSSNSYEGTYDGAAHSITVTAPDGAVIRYRTAASGEYDLTEIPAYTDVGDYKVYYRVTKDNYIPVEGSEDVKISEAALTGVSVSQNGTLTYTGSPQVPEVMEKATAVGSQSVTFTYSRTESGEYGQMPSVTNVSDSGIFYYKAKAPNHSDATGSFTVTVDKAANPATVTTEATVIEGGNTIDLKDTVSMNGATGEVSYAFGGDEMGCTLDGSVLTSGTKTGTVSVNVTVAEDDNYNALPATPVTVTITNKGIQTISANDVTVTYGDTDKSVSAEVTDPKTGAGKISYAVKEGSTDYIEVNEETGALNIKEVPADGKAYVTVTAAETMIYAKATRDVAITISKAASTAATVSANNLTYDTGEHDLVTVTGEATGGTMNYVLGKDAVAAPASGWETTIPKKSDAGTYYVWFKVKGDGNHEDTVPACVSVTVAKADPKTPAGLTAVYGQTLSEVTLKEGWAWKDGTQRVGNVGTNTFKADYTPASPNYKAKSNVDLTVSVNRAPSTPATVSGNNLIYSGKEQELVTVERDAEGGTMNYCLGNDAGTAPTEGWAEAIPTAKDAGTYYVWYMVKGGDNHYDSAPACVSAEIDKADPEYSAPKAMALIYNGQAQELVSEGKTKGGEMLYAPGTATEPTDAYKASIPTETEPGTYYVWYMVKGDGNHNDTRPSVVEVKIDPIEVKSIGLRAVNGTTMVPGTSQQIEATIVPSNASVKYLTWSSSNPVVSVNNAGLITVKPDNDIDWGDKNAVEAVITAEAENEVKASITITVVNPKTEVKSVEIDKTSVKKDAKPGDTFRLTAVIKPDEATDKTVTWESDKPEVAEVGEYTGIVTVKKTGDAKITVWAARGTLSDNTVLNIRKVSVNGITIDTTGGDDYLVTGRAAGLSAIVTPADATEKGVIWSSDPEDVASVDEHGIVTAKKEGRVRITAISIDNPSVKASKDFIVFGSDDSLYVEFVGSSDYTYTGSAITPAVNVYYRGEMLTSDADYTVSYKNNKNANDASNVKKAPTVKVTGKTVAATVEAVFKILPADIGDEDLVTAQEVIVTSGKKAAPELYFGGTKLAGNDFTNPYAKDKFYNSRPITVYGKGNFTGEREIWINVKTEQEVKNQPKIKVKSFTPVKRSYNGLSQLLSDNEITVVSSTDKGKTKTPLTMDKDFYIAYPGDTTNAGTVKIAVVGMGDYTGVVTKTYRIEAAKDDDVAKEGVEVSFPYSEDTHTEGEVDYDTFTYRPGGVLPYAEVKVTLQDGDVEMEETLVCGRDYKVTYKDNKKAAVANKGKLSTATIIFKGNYKSLKKVEKKFYIKQADLAAASVYAGNKVVTKGNVKYPLQAPVVDIDGVTVKKSEYTVTYTDADDKPLDNKSKLNLKVGESAEVKVVIKAKKDKSGAESGNYTGTNESGSYKITLAEASKDLSKAKVIIQKKDDDTHKAVRKFDFTGKPIVIGDEPNEGYELYVYFGKKANAPDKILEEGTDYTIEYSNNVKAGKATIILNAVDGSVNCFGSRTHTFNIVKGIMRWVK